MKGARSERWAVSEFDFTELLLYAAGDLREAYEKRHGCNMGFETGCETHPTCFYWPKVFAVWVEHKNRKEAKLARK